MPNTITWRVRCETESADVTTVQATKPTVCPNDGGHTITAALTAIISIVKNKTFHINFKAQTTTSTTWKELKTFIFDGSDDFGTITKIGVLSIKKSDVDGYVVRIYDSTNSLAIATSGTLTNNTQAINDLGTISNVPTGEAIFELQLKKTTGNGGWTGSKSIKVTFVE